MYNKDNFLNSFCQFLSFYLPYSDYFICNICHCFFVAIDYNYLYSITKTQKKPYNQGFSLLIHTKLSRLLRATLHTRRFGLTVSFRRCPSSFYESYSMCRRSASTSLMPQLVQAVIPPQHVLRAFFYTNRRKGVKMIFK